MSYVVCWGFFFGNNYTHLFKLSLLCDINGRVRSRRLSYSSLQARIGKGRKLPISPNDIPQGLAEYFHSLRLNFSRFFGRGHQDIVNAVKTFNKRKKSTQNDEIMDDELEGE